MQRFICQPGMIVRTDAGRDAGRFFLVTGCENDMLLLADGGRRPLSKPKRKNPLHTHATRHSLPLEGLTDKALRNALRPLNEAANPAAQTCAKQNQTRNRLVKEVTDDVETGCN